MEDSSKSMLDTDSGCESGYVVKEKKHFCKRWMSGRMGNVVCGFMPE